MCEEKRVTVCLKMTTYVFRYVSSYGVLQSFAVQMVHMHTRKQENIKYCFQSCFTNPFRSICNGTKLLIVVERLKRIQNIFPSSCSSKVRHMGKFIQASDGQHLKCTCINTFCSAVRQGIGFKAFSFYNPTKTFTGNYYLCRYVTILTTTKKGTEIIFLNYHQFRKNMINAQ